jgi:hypothetical protein
MIRRNSAMATVDQFGCKRLVSRCKRLVPRGERDPHKDLSNTLTVKRLARLDKAHHVGLFRVTWM